MIEAITDHIAANPGQGFFLLNQTFRNEGKPWGKTRLWRVERPHGPLGDLTPIEYAQAARNSGFGLSP